MEVLRSIIKMFKIKVIFAVFIFLNILSTGVAQSSDLPHKCGTFHQNNLNRSFEISELAEYRISESGIFRVQYYSDGPDVSTSDYVDSTLAILDQVYNIQINELGYDPPPLIDSYYHVVLTDLSSERIYGRTYISGDGVNLTSSIELDNDYLDTIYPTRGLNGLRVTIAHEYFHAVQFGYRYEFGHGYLYEMEAVWMEDLIYDNINDYRNYLNSFFNTPELSIRTANGQREYGAGLFIKVLAEGFDKDLIRQSWDLFEVLAGDPIEHLFQAMENSNVTKREFAEKYISWMTYTGDRWIFNYGFSDGYFYPTIELSNGNVADLEWEEELGEWGLILGKLSGGVQGEPNLEINALYEPVAITTVRNENSVSLLHYDDSGSLNGSFGTVGAVSLYEDTQVVNLRSTPERVGSPNAITIYAAYPNPATNISNRRILLDKPADVSIQIYNILGQLVYAELLPSNLNREILYSWPCEDRNGRHVASGMYILRANAGEAVNSQKIVVFHEKDSH